MEGLIHGGAYFWNVTVLIDRLLKFSRYFTST